ncbi:MAG: hypothetical protein U5Q44_08700 [Dehalococcoidia bacterium]|nr:hypothetical protein [Dehalococcoidia bacterium]
MVTWESAAGFAAQTDAIAQRVAGMVPCVAVPSTWLQPAGQTESPGVPTVNRDYRPVHHPPEHRTH